MKLTQEQLQLLINESFLSEDGKDLYGICPWCGKNEFGISLVEENNPYNCFRKKACGQSGNIYSLLKHLGKSKDFLGEREIDLEGGLSSLIDEAIEEEEELVIVDPPIGWKRVLYDDYLVERGFKDHQFQKHQVGRCRFQKDYVTFLIEMNGRVTGYISRSIKSKAWIDAYNEEAKRLDSTPYLRYKNSTSDFSRMLFGYDEIIKGKTTDVILVEGIFSKTKTDDNLDLDFEPSMKCVATFGAKVSEHQIKLLRDKGVINVWLWFEADVLAKVKKIAAQLSIYFNVYVSFLNEFDPGDIDKETAFKLLDSSMSFIEIDQNYL